MAQTIEYTGMSEPTPENTPAASQSPTENTPEANTKAPEAVSDEPTKETSTTEAAKAAENSETQKTETKEETKSSTKGKKTKKEAGKKEDTKDKKIDKAKKAHKKRAVRRHILFFLICFISAFTVFWTFAHGWQTFKAGENESWFHEVLGAFCLIGLCVLSYFKIYRQSRVYLSVVEQKEAEEKAAREAHEKIEREKKEKTFRKLIADFHAAESFEATSVAMTKLLTVGIESPRLRQEIITIVGELNNWMYENKIFLAIQQLMAWRIKKTLFEKSDKFQIDTGTQDLSIKAINIIEAITKRHIIEYKEGKVDFTLDLSNIAVPTLTLTSQYIPAGSVFFENSILWQASFSETIIQGTSFLSADLQKASFWRAKLDNIDFEKANLKHAKLRTDLQKARNLKAQQFFNTKEWELCFISRDQTNSFFPDQDDSSPNWERWMSARDRREKLYFNFEQL